MGPYLGGGGFGDVYLALDRQGRTVAIKLIRPEALSKPNIGERLRREVQTMRLVNNPRVAEIIDFNLDAEQPFVITRYVPGRSLWQLVHDEGHLGVADLIRLARGLAEALTAIHDQNVVHRDLKPDNVMMADGDPVVIDFSIAHSIREPTIPGDLVGTPGYIPPEAYNGPGSAGGNRDSPRDVFCWGATVAFAATGLSPYGIGGPDCVKDRVLNGEHYLERVPEPLRRIVALTLETDPSLRPTARQLVDAVSRLHYPPESTVTADRLGKHLSRPTPGDIQPPRSVERSPAGYVRPAARAGGDGKAAWQRRRVAIACAATIVGAGLYIVISHVYRASQSNPYFDGTLLVALVIAAIVAARVWWRCVKIILLPLIVMLGVKSVQISVELAAALLRMLHG
jgi:serine/threonine protein kinase